MIESPEIGQVVWVRGYGNRVLLEPGTVVSAPDGDGRRRVKLADEYCLRQGFYTEEEALTQCLLRAAEVDDG